MNVNPGTGREELSMDRVRTQLKAISAIEPPQSLRNRLEASIPVAGGTPIARCIWPYWERIRWAGAATAAVMMISLVAWLGTPWGRQIHSTIDANSSPGRVYATDHNNLRPSDTNSCDINGVR
jgi:hypothetical protein